MRHVLLHANYFLRDEPLLVSIQDNLTEELLTGCQVLFSPVGNSRKSIIGYVVREVDSPQQARQEGTITEILNSGLPLLTPVTLRLSKWIADYYIARPIEAINAVLPAPLKTRVSETVELSDFQLLSFSDKKVVTTPLRKEILKQLHQRKKMTVRQLESRLGKQNLYRTLIEMERGGLVTIKKTFKTTGAKTRTAYRLKEPFTESLPESLSRAPRQAEAVRRLHDLEMSWSFPEQIGTKAAIARELVKKGIFESLKVEVDSGFSSGFTEPKKIIKNLTGAQQSALESLIAGFRTGTFSTSLLHGITGSGKTIIYIELLKEVLSAGKSAIVLVPEISLTPQTASRFRQHFGDNIQILHSAMNNQEKYNAWHKLRTGKAKIALGARSTIFAPLENVGAIIVDEEHDSAYKQDRTPRYHGRDTAVMRAKLENAICVLGSATPSFESFHNAETGKYNLLRLPERVDGASIPSVKLVPLRENRKISFSLSEVLYEQIKARLERNEQVILLQNRRGFAGSLLCLDCGHIPTCSHCNIPMVYHAASRQLRCHYCGHALAYKETCTRCSSDNILYKSSGTERIEEELRGLFPGEKILRMDVDTTGIKGAHSMILKDFHEKKARILLGTQMVAKGLDFPDVTLVGVLLADIGLNLPDFRSGERLFALLTQVAGRAGRAKIPGEVYLQTYNTDNEVFVYLMHGSYEKYYEKDMQARKELFYPPYARLVSCKFSSPDEHTAEQASDEFAKAFTPYLSPENCILLGPSPAGIPRIRGRYRYQILLKLPGKNISADSLKKLQYALMRKYNRHDLTVTIDVDPQNIM
ncbi:MAG: primosomal protein N' [Chlorobium phaeobacteroides]|uniref:Replication restart protein PriA n=1 Tax=Chlorobium phaeobacteroides (strain BS1) TaxID=331678 RepID=B3EJF8_CHLPB|nr:primosomal protein N' [Chlorobium phaeobacteroides]